MKQQGGFFYLGKTALILALTTGFFYWPNTVFPPYLAAETRNILINEVAWMGTAISANDEWIELANTTDFDISLEGWTLAATDGQPNIVLSGSVKANDFFLLERTDNDSVPGIGADMIFAGALGNTGEILELKNNIGEIVDKIDASGGWPAGDNVSKLTMARSDLDSWLNSEATGGTPRAKNFTNDLPNNSFICGNNIIEGEEACDDGNRLSDDGCGSDCQIETADDGNESIPSLGTDKRRYRFGDILINEFCPDPTDGDEEWIELYNARGEEIDLSGWTIEEGGGGKTLLDGSISGYGGDRYIIVSKPKGSLNNGGDAIYLRDSFGTNIDVVAYGNWDDGYIDDNAPPASDPNVVARYADSMVSNINSEDFAITSKPTKGTGNIIINDDIDESPSGSNAVNYDYSDDIFITEIFPNPVGADNEAEFVELFNFGNRDINLGGWEIADDNGAKYTIGNADEAMIIKSQGYLLIYRSESRIALNNNYDSVSLFAPLKTKAKQTVKYNGAKENWSYGLAIESNGDWKKAKWEWSEKTTPGAANEFKTINHKPTASFDAPETVPINVPVTLDSSDTYDEDGDKLEFAWDFGDQATSSLANPQHLYKKIGSYKITLVVSDGTDSVKKTTKIKITAANATMNGAASDLTGNDSDDITYDLVLNEMMPSPEGSDEDGEWIEVYNRGVTKINLLDWSISDLSGKKYYFADNIYLESGKYFVLDRETSGLSLNNNLETINLSDNNGEQVDSTNYDKALAGASFVRDRNNKWQWSLDPTPGTENTIVLAKTTTKAGAKVKSKTNSKKQSVIETTLENIRNMEIGDQVRVKGVVAVMPGVFGSQYFYIVGSPGIQVYNYKKDFPTMKVGDLMEVSGEITSVSGEMRVKTAGQSDMKILEHKAAPLGAEITCDKINEDCVGSLYTVSGEIAEIKSSSIFLDDGTEEAVIYVKKNTGISPKSFQAGDRIRVTGIAGKTSSGIRIMPRSPEDIIKENKPGQVLGEVSASDEWELEQRDKKLEFYRYSLLIALGAIIALIIFFFKYRKTIL